MKRPPSFSVQFDRSIARARVNGNEKLAEHLERLRPALNLKSNDEGEVFARASHAFSDIFIAVAKELDADPFDVLLMLAATCTAVVEKMRVDGLEFRVAMATLIKTLEEFARKTEMAINGG